MFLWFENESLAVQFAILLLSILAVVLFIQWIFNYSAKARDWSEGTQTSFMSPIALCFGLVASFTFLDVITLFDKAKAEVTHEASSLYTVLDLAELTPKEMQAPLEAIIREHVSYVVEKERPLMRNRTASLSDRDDYLVQAYRVLNSSESINSLQADIQKQIMTNLENARSSQTYRIIVSQTFIHPLKWAVLIILAFMVLVTMAISHASTPKSRLLTMLVLSVAEVAFFISIVAFDHAFGGDVFVTPDPLLKLLKLN